VTTLSSLRYPYSPYRLRSWQVYELLLRHSLKCSVLTTQCITGRPMPTHMLLSAMPPVDDDMHVAHIGHNAVLLIQLPKPAATFPSAICEIRNSSLNCNRGRARGVFLSQLLPVYPRSPDSASCQRRLVLNQVPSKSDTLVFPPKTSPPRQLIGHASSNGIAHLPQEAHTRTYTYTHAHAHLNPFTRNRIPV
jgi:hypothetical protein